MPYDPFSLQLYLAGAVLFAYIIYVLYTGRSRQRSRYIEPQILSDERKR